MPRSRMARSEPVRLVVHIGAQAIQDSDTMTASLDTECTLFLRVSLLLELNSPRFDSD